MAEKTIVLKIKGSDPLCVSAQRLTADSRKFRELINELSFTEEEMYDFDPDTVCLFLTLLEDRKVEEIQDQHFRELHKMSVVYEVNWLIEKCREWLVNRINGIDSNMEYEARLYLFEECRYILNKWELSTFMNLLMSKDNTALISQYARDFDKLDSKQLDLMLKLGGGNATLFLELVLQNLSGKQFLDSNTKHLLDKMNLVLCLEQNEQLYDQLFETLLAMSELTTTDLRFILKLKDSARIAYSRIRNSKISSSNIPIVDVNVWVDRCKNYTKLEDITCRVEDKRINNMFVVVDLLVYVVRESSSTKHATGTTEEAEVFVSRLENLCQAKRPLKKTSPQYIDGIIAAMKLSPRQQKVEVIALLEKIKNSDKLCSCHDNVILSLTPDEIIKVKLSTGTVYKLPFEFKHPETPACHMSGKCGFIIKTIKQEGNWKYELCKEDTDYNDTGLHPHEIVSSEEMHFCGIESGTTQEGDTVRGHGRCNWKWWLPTITDWKLEQYSVAYNVTNVGNVSRYLVAKQD